jgi:hypothetical protein
VTPAAINADHSILFDFSWTYPDAILGEAMNCCGNNVLGAVKLFFCARVNIQTEKKAMDDPIYQSFNTCYIGNLQWIDRG